MSESNDFMAMLVSENNAAIAALDANPDALVYQIWEDGEVTFNHNGRLRCLSRGFTVRLPVGLFPRKHNDHGFTLTLDYVRMVDAIGTFMDANPGLTCPV